MDNASYEFSHDMVEITAKPDQLELRYHEPVEVRGEDGVYRVRRNSFTFAFSYAEAEAIAEAVATARQIAQTANITLTLEKE